MRTTPLPLGMYTGDPNGSSASADATFAADYSGFVANMAATPQFLDTFVDYTQPVSAWVSNASWQAWSDAVTPDAQHLTPVIGLPMYSTQAGALTPDQQYKAIIAGQDDSTLAGIVQAYGAQGFSNLIFRPGWEMNLAGPTYAGNTAQDQSDWVAAFQHIYTTLHAAAAADGVTATVVWNPGTTNYASVSATTTLYPGNNYVDAIGADVYSDIYPFSDGGSTPTYHDWATGGEDATIAQFIANPINRAHYWSYPAATEWSLDSSGGRSLSLNNIIQFAEQQGKPLAIPETGAGNSNAATDVQDDAAFPQWLSQQLTAAQATGEKIDFVNIWDSNGGGNYEFSNAADGKPLEAAAWAKYFGGLPPVPLTVTPGAVTMATTDKATVEPFAGLTITDENVAQTDTAVVTLSSIANGTLSDPNAAADGGIVSNGSYTVSGTAAAVSAALDGLVFTPTPQQAAFGLVVSTAITAALSDPAGETAAATTTVAATSVSVSTTIGSGNDTLVLQISEDAYLGNAQFTVSVDGVKVGGVQTAAATHAGGQDQTFDVLGNWGAGSHTVAVNFLNDLYGGTPQADRNLYVDGASYDGAAQPGASLSLHSSGTQSMTVKAPAPATTTIGSGSDTLALRISQDAYLGNAQFTVSVDGVKVGGVQTAAAAHAGGQDQTVNVMGSWGAGTHTVAVSFLNDLYGGTPQADRNLYVDGASYDGTAQVGASLSLHSTGTQSLAVVSSTTYSEGNAGGSLTTLGNDIVTIGSGAVQLNAKGPSVKVVGGTGALSFIAHGGNDTVTAGLGAITVSGSKGLLNFVDGTGPATVTLGTGAAVFAFTNGLAGGALTITDFVPGTDLLHLVGYSGTGIASQQVVGGSTQITLTDTTRITLIGITGPTAHSLFG